MELVANFTLNNESLDAEFDISDSANFDALFEIYASPTKVSQLENDLNFQTEIQVSESIQNALIPVEEEINTKVDTVIGSDLIGVTREDNTVTLTSKTYVHEQGVASDTWVIAHNLDKYPSVTLVDSTETEFFAEVEYNDKNNCTIYLNGATKGKAYLN